jgi:hypothetical protein
LKDIVEADNLRHGLHLISGSLTHRDIVATIALAMSRTGRNKTCADSD